MRYFIFTLLFLITLTHAALSLHHNAFAYSGEYTDEESHLQYLKARYYDPQTSRFIEWDRYKKKKALFDNTYNYGADNPIMNVDPSGQVRIKIKLPDGSITEIAEEEFANYEGAIIFNEEVLVASAIEEVAKVVPNLQLMIPQEPMPQSAQVLAAKPFPVRQISQNDGDQLEAFIQEQQAQHAVNKEIEEFINEGEEGDENIVPPRPRGLSGDTVIYHGPNPRINAATVSNTNPNELTRKQKQALRQLLDDEEEDGKQ